MTITYYTSTSTLQFRENKASDSTTHIKSLKDIHPEALPSTALPETNINDRDALLNSSLDLSSESSNNSSMVANFNPETPDIMYQMHPWRVIPFVRSMKDVSYSTQKLKKPDKRNMTRKLGALPRGKQYL